MLDLPPQPGVEIRHPAGSTALTVPIPSSAVIAGRGKPQTPIGAGVDVFKYVEVIPGLADQSFSFAPHPITVVEASTTWSTAPVITTASLPTGGSRQTIVRGSELMAELVTKLLSSIGRAMTDSGGASSSVAKLQVNIASPEKRDTTVMANLHKAIENAFLIARSQRFEDGYQSDFGRSIESAILAGGTDAVGEIMLQIHSPSTEPEVAREALVTLALIESNSTLERRREIAEAGLTHREFAVRDGAILAIARLGDPKSVAPLRAALARETAVAMKSEIQQVIEELEAA